MPIFVLLAYAASCDSGTCQGPPPASEILHLSIVAYEDGQIDVPVGSNLGRGLLRTIVLAQPPSHGRLSIATGGGHVTYRPRVGFTGADSFSLSLTAADWTTLGIAISVEVRNSYVVSPQVFGELRRGAVPPGEQDRAELADSGEYALVQLSILCSRLGCEHTQAGDTHVVRYGTEGLRWVEGNAFVNNLAGDYQQFPLPAVPSQDSGEWWVPIRFFAEMLGFSTALDPADRSIRAFQLLPSLRQIPLHLSKRVVGADFGTSRLFSVTEDRDYYWLLYDASSDIIKLRKSDFSYSKVSIDPQLGSIHSFVVTAPDDIYIGTSLGYLLHWRGGALTTVTGAGKHTLGSPGEMTALSDFKAEFVSDLVARPDGRVIYMYDWIIGSLYEIDLDKSSVRMLASAPEIGGLTNLSLVDGRPEWVGESGLHVIDPATLVITHSQCFNQLFSPSQIQAAYYLAAKDVWLMLDARKREIVEAHIPLASPVDDCGVVRRTFAGDRSSFLFTFARSNDSEADGALVVDNSSRLLIRYTVGGATSITTPEQLGASAHLSWLGPVMALQRGSDLFVVANRSHQVVRYSLPDGTTVDYLGSGEPSREGPADGDPLALDIGFPSVARFVDGELWLGDNYNRRIVATDGATAQLVLPSVDPAIMGAVTSFDRVDDTTYIADHGLGRILALKSGRLVPVAGTANSDALLRSAGSIAGMTTFASVRFGLPVSITAFASGTLLVADDGRKGIWALDPATGAVRPIAGFRTPIAGSTWGPVGNVGLAAKDLRLAGLSSITYDAGRHVILVPSNVGRQLVFVSDDLSKTCAADLRSVATSPQQAFFLEDGRLAVVDYDSSAVLIFDPPDLSCLATGRPL